MLVRVGPGISHGQCVGLPNGSTELAKVLLGAVRKTPNKFGTPMPSAPSPAPYVLWLDGVFGQERQIDEVMVGYGGLATERRESVSL